MMKKWEDRRKKVEQLAQSFQRNPLAACYRPRLWLCQPSSVWRLFPRQTLAISFAQSCKEDVHVFALEKESSSQGQRMYLVTSYSELWHYYRTYTQSLMHCYEVIPEGAVCKLYFDLEFHRPSNTGADGKAMVSSLIQYVCEMLMEAFGIECTTKNILNLDSSTEDKFSRHLIFNLQNAAFKDNIHVGKFIHSMFQKVLSTLKSRSNLEAGKDLLAENGTSGTCGPPEGTAALGDVVDGSPPVKRNKHEERDLHFLWVKNKEGQDCLFVDLGVYNRNRNFRLYKSSKVGSNAAFTVADDNEFIAKPQRGVSAEESLFLASLVCNVSFTGQRILTWDVPETTETKRPASQQGFKSVSLCGYISSPYQDVDDFVLTVVTKDGIQGSIRRWNYFAAEQLLVYDVANYRWCENVDRFHKSNNIMIIVDLKEEVWYQKCHDPDCKNFRSSSHPLPQEICMSYIMTLDEEDQVYLMDDTGNIELSQTPKQPSESTVAPDVSADVWADKEDDQAYLESLDSFEGDNCEISDQLLLKCMEDFDNQ